MKLNPQSPMPLYRQLVDILLEKIRSGEYAPGSRIPAETKLAEDFGIGRPTVRQATDFIIRKGLLTRKRGSGTYVRQEPEEIDLLSLEGTIASFRKSGIDPQIRLIRPIRLISVSAEAENPFAGRFVYFLSRLSLVEQKPVLIEEMYFRPDLFPNLDQINFNGRSISATIEEVYFFRAAGGKQVFRVEKIGKERGAVLGVGAGVRVLQVKRHVWFAGVGEGVYAELYLRTDQYAFTQFTGGPEDE